MRTLVWCREEGQGGRAVASRGEVLSRAQDGSLGGRARCRRADRSVVGRLLMVREEGLVVLVVSRERAAETCWGCDGLSEAERSLRDPSEAGST